MKVVKAFAAIAVLALTACGAQTPSQQATDAAAAEQLSREFQAPYSEVVQAAEQALRNQKLKLKDATSGPDQTAISFSKPVSGFSWGETGQVVVQRTGSGSARAIVSSSPNVALNITATKDTTFASNIFAEMTSLLQGS